MWLKQKVFTFSIERVGEIQDDNLDNVKVKLNGKLTTINLVNLFSKIRYHEFSKDGKSLEISGWSILQELKDEKFVFEEGKTIDFSFEAEDMGSLELIKIENPWFILNDVEISNDEFTSFINKIVELSGHTDESEADGGLPQTEPSVFINEIYNKALPSFQKRGFIEYGIGNFRLLKSDNKLILVELLGEKDLVQYNEYEKVVDDFYKFKSEDESKVFNVKIIEEGLFVDIIDYEEIKEDKNSIELEDDISL